MRVTLDLSDLLLTKLQIVELNEKDAQDVLYPCSAYPVRDGDEPGTIGLGPDPPDRWERRGVVAYRYP